MIIFGSVIAVLIFLFFLTKFLYRVLRFKIKSDNPIMLILTIFHLLLGIVLFPLYPILNRKLPKFDMILSFLLSESQNET